MFTLGGSEIRTETVSCRLVRDLLQKNKTGLVTVYFAAYFYLTILSLKFNDWKY